MDKDRDLLPWILGGLSLSSVALAVAVAATNRMPPSVASAPLQSTVQALPAVALPSPAELPPPAQIPANAAATTAPPMQSAGQIWTCTVGGQKIFSNNPCGDNSTLLDLGPINTMDRAPLYRGPRAYPPGPGYGNNYGDPDSQDSPDNSYPSMVAYPVVVQRNPPRTHRPFNHSHSPSARRY